jgi:two-component system, sensor histidine kinase and response regulator
LKKRNEQHLKAQQKELRRANDEILTLNKNLEKRVFERTRELENLNHELKDLNLSKDKFLSVISHDLRNPLTALLISSDALSHDTEDHIFDKFQPYIKVIHRTSHKILQQLNELVDWAQGQQEKTTLKSEKLHLVHGVDQSLELLKANALQKNIVLENKVHPDIYVNADALMLRSILQNLVTNAIKYTPQSGLITVNAQRIDKMVEICITDSGIGMETDISENLFTNSHSASVSGTNNEKGSGLGLILVKDFVTQHGGTIRVESELGKGTYIFFTVPKY